jgi:hypothetical protein
MDDSGQITTGNTTHITVHQPYVSQNWEIIGDLDRRHTVIFENVDEAQLKILRNGESFLTKTLTASESPYIQELENLHKGEYLSTLETLTLSDTASTTILDFIPTMTVEGERNFNEGGTVEWLVGVHDINDEDEPELIEATSLDQKVSLERQGNRLIVTGIEGKVGDYDVELKGGSPGGVTDTIISGYITDLPDISGQLQDLRTDLPTQGRIKLYRGSISQSSFLEEIFTDANGNFYFRASDPIPDSEKLILRAVSDGGEFPDSNLVRTISIPSRDTSNLIIRSYVYPRVLFDSGVGSEKIIDHLYDMNPDFIRSLVRGMVLVGPDFFNKGSIPDETLNLYTNLLNDPSGGQCTLEEILPLNVVVDKGDLPESERHYSNSGLALIPEDGWGVVYRDTTLSKDGSTKPFLNEGNYIKSFRVKMNKLHGGLFIHETIGHGLGLAPLDNHAEILQSPLTIMNPIVSSEYLGIADCEAFHLLYESTFPLMSKREDIAESKENF